MMNGSYFIRVHGTSDMFADDDAHFYTVNANPITKRMQHTLVLGENVVKQGYLIKRGSKVKNLKRRWFIIIGTELRYYKSDALGGLLGSLNLQYYRVLPSDLPSRSHRVIKLLHSDEDGDDKAFYMEAISDSEFVEWSRALAALSQQVENKSV